MTFDRAWVLPFALLPLLWMFWEFRAYAPARRADLERPGVLRRSPLALAEPRLTTNETKMAVAVLVDTSASIGAAGSGPRVATGDQRIESGRGRHWFACFRLRSRRVTPLAAEHPGGWSLQYTSGDARHSHRSRSRHPRRHRRTARRYGPAPGPDLRWKGERRKHHAGRLAGAEPGHSHRYLSR